MVSAMHIEFDQFHGSQCGSRCEAAEILNHLLTQVWRKQFELEGAGPVHFRQRFAVEKLANGQDGQRVAECANPHRASRLRRTASGLPCNLDNVGEEVFPYPKADLCR